VKARRRQNAIDNLNAVSKAASRSGARRDGRPQRDFESLKKSARHLLVRTPVLPQLRIAETHYIKAETANPHAGINAADEKSVADLLPATGETGIAETGRAGQGKFGSFYVGTLCNCGIPVENAVFVGCSFAMVRLFGRQYYFCVCKQEKVGLVRGILR
jgi:hypothetical protein